ncbi:MAG: hypothetical protein ACHQNE_01190 [Candidatus Kapaibacterium sp.]
MSPDPFATEDSSQDKKGKPNGGNTPVEIEIAKWTKRMSIATVWLAVGTGLLALFTIKLSCDSGQELSLARISDSTASVRDSVTSVRDSIREIKDSLRTDAQDTFQRRTLDSTGKQLDIARNTMTSQLRAYLIVDNDPKPDTAYARIDTTKPIIWAQYIIKNVGQTPAYSVQCWMLCDAKPPDASIGQFDTSEKLPLV